MADNVGIATGTDATVAADDIGGVLYQRVKLAVGADGAAADLAPGQAAMASSLPVVIANNQSAVPVSDNSSTLSVDDGAGSLTVDNAGTFAVQATLAAETTKIIGTVNIAAAQSVALAAGTAGIGKLTANSGVDIGDVDVTSIAAGDNNIGNVDIVTGPTGANALQVQGTAAHDATAAQNPILLGAEALSAERAVVATTDVTKLVADLVGKLIVLPYANPENFLKGNTAAITDTTRTAVIAAQGAGVRIYVTHIIVTNSHASVGTYVKIEDDTTEIYGGYAASAGGGFSITLPTPLRLTANKALNVSCGTTGANVYVSASGYNGV